MKHQAPCPMCGQLVFIEAPEDTDEQELMELAKQSCNCEGAVFERARIKKMNKISSWVEKEFAEDESAKRFMQSAISCIGGRIFDKLTIKEGKHTYTIDLDKDGLIRIKSKFTENTENRF